MLVSLEIDGDGMSAKNMSPEMKAFAKNVKTRREKKDLSITDLAKKAGLQRTYVSEIESGKRSITLDKAAEISAALSTSLAAMLRVK